MITASLYDVWCAKIEFQADKPLELEIHFSSQWMKQKTSLSPGCVNLIPIYLLK